jgi:O-antigen ligase
MSNALAIIRSLIIYGLCLPLAVYLGYVVANPMDRVSMVVVLTVVALPLIPVLLKWHHLILILSWNMSMVLFFVQGSPYLWMAMTATSLLLTILQQILKRDVQFLNIPSITWSLLFMAFVIFITAKLTGGFGIRSFGGASYGGKRYVQLFCAIAGFFAITAYRIPKERAILYTALFFLGTLSMVMGSLGPWLPASMYFLFALFPVDSLLNLSSGATENMRLGGVTFASVGIVAFILARHGMTGLFNITQGWRFLPLQFRGGFGVNQPWRLLGCILIGIIGLSGGYRSVTIMFIMIFTGLFFLERLYKTNLAPILIVVGTITLAVAIPFVPKMPLNIQRSLSFLPIEIDPMAKRAAQDSSDWRINIWKEVVPTIPQYLIVGKGYGMDPRAVEMAVAYDQINATDDGSGAIAAADFHNGPLSLIIPLGIFGTIAFLWFLVASIRVLINNYKYGDPELHQINTFILVYFLTKTFFFFAVFGSFQNEFAFFTGLIAMSISLNGGMARRPVETVVNPAHLPFRLPKAARV